MAPAPNARRSRRSASKDPDVVAFGAQLRTLREAAGLTQEDLAHSAGLHWTYVGQIERGERNLSYKNLLRLAHGLGVAPSALVSGEPVVPFEPEPQLTATQIELVALLAAGKTPQQIATARQSSLATVQAVLRRAGKQAGVADHRELATWARQHGYTSS